ncbi:hypothetical protein D3C87_35710 [compost metagenome]
MIRLALFLVLILAVSCRSAKSNADSAAETPKTAEKPKIEMEVEEPIVPSPNDTVTKSYYLGVVKKLDCGYAINITLREDFSLYYNPINLDPKFQVDGLRLKLKYRRGQKTTRGCIKYGQVEIVEAFVVR